MNGWKRWLFAVGILVVPMLVVLKPADWWIASLPAIALGVLYLLNLVTARFGGQERSRTSGLVVLIVLLAFRVVEDRLHISQSTSHTLAWLEIAFALVGAFLMVRGAMPEYERPRQKANVEHEPVS